MSPLRLQGSTSGYSQIDAPAVAGDQTFTLPGTGGTLTTAEGGQTIEFGAGSASTPSITTTGDSNTGIYFPAADTIAFSEGGAEAARIDSSGRLLVGTSTARSNFYNTSTVSPQLQIEGTTYSTSTLSIVTNNTSGTGGYPSLVFGKSAGSTVGSNTAVSDGHYLGEISFQGNDGTEFVDGARITAVVDGISGANDLPTRLVLSTTPDGSASPVERMRISANGDVDFWYTTDFNGLTRYYNANWSTTNYHYIVKDASGNLLVYNQANNGVYLTNGGTAWNANSDERLKTDLQPIDNGLAKVSSLRAVTGRYITDEESASRPFLIAQDVQKVLPEAVDIQNDEQKTLGLRYTEIIPLLVAALKESKERIETLEAKVAALEGASPNP